jgi:hypothetical protein
MRRKSALPSETDALKRRALVTAAVACVAGAFTKLLARPAAAGHDGTNILHLGETNQVNSWTTLINTGQDTALYLFNNRDATIYSVNQNGPALFGFSYGGGTAQGDGIQGFSYNGPNSLNGVRGQAMKPNVSGVYGENTGTGGYGVAGRSPSTGVYGETTGSGHGVIGKSYAAGIGVRGDSDFYFGVSGKSRASYGVSAISDQAIGLYARGRTYAAYFANAIFVAGNLTATGAKSAIVSHPDGSKRRLYGVESPESWFEDFGRAALKDGQVEVNLDPDFVALVSNDGYQVFLTPYGDCKGLYVSNRTAKGFIVRELQGGTSSIELGYRVVAKRKDIPGPRLEKVELPQALEPPQPPDPPPPPLQPEPLRPPEPMRPQARVEPREPPDLSSPPVHPEPLGVPSRRSQ